MVSDPVIRIVVVPPAGGVDPDVLFPPLEQAAVAHTTHATRKM
jgi:hypothetical protein